MTFVDEPLWTDPTPVVRYVLPWCRVAQQAGKPFTDIAHGRCPVTSERPGQVQHCTCPCHRHGDA